MTTTQAPSLRDALAALKGGNNAVADVQHANDSAPVRRPSETPGRQPAFRRSAAQTTRLARPNKFPGFCATCHQRVEADAGILGEKVNGKYTIKHKPGQCPEARPSEFRAEPKREVPNSGFLASLVNRDRINPAPGLYTVDNGSGHTTFCVYAQPEDRDFAPGKTLLKRLTGSDNSSDYTTVGFLQGGKLVLFKRYRPVTGAPPAQWLIDARTLLTDPEAVLTAKHCIKCNRTLTTPESIAAGIGPDCAGKV
jgi:Family of unknown function (DUF6011)